MTSEPADDRSPKTRRFAAGVAAGALFRRLTRRRTRGGRSGLKDVRCAKCGCDRGTDTTLTATTRTPCRQCGATSLRYERHFTAVATANASVSTALTPGRQERDWQLRWAQIQTRVVRLGKPRTEPRGAAAIHDAAQEVLDFFVFAYHFKDMLIQDGVVAKNEAERMITNAPRLALLADVANLDKHRRLTRPPRSGAVPAIKVSDISNGETWNLVFEIQHDGTAIDGIGFANEIVTTWSTALRAWGLVT